MAGGTRLSNDERAEYKGCRIENAAEFTSVARGITEADVSGDYPNIVEALKAVGIDAKAVELSADKAKTEPAVNTGMTDEQNALVLIAIGELVEKTPGKKPNVKDVEEITGFSITAGGRDVAWSEFQELNK